MSLDIDLVKTIECCSCCGREREEIHVYEGNITHNLSKMATVAGAGILWSDEKSQYATDLIDPLEKALNNLTEHPERFKTYEDPNGWGTVEDLKDFIEDLLEACSNWPEANVRSCR